MTNLLQSDQHNPLDSLENLFDVYNWSFDRPTEEEILLSLAGKTNNYCAYFQWDENLKMLQICYQYDFTVNQENSQNINDIINRLNQNLSIGHIEWHEDNQKPCFRYASVMGNLSSEQAQETIRHMIDLSIDQCERYAPLLKLLGARDLLSDDDITLASLETAGSC